MVSVNPLVSIQLTKDEDGEKVVKPFVNLHVTPNDFLVQKLGSFIHNKKQAFHHHVHEHNYPRPPSYYGHHEPVYHHPPPHHHLDHYQPHGDIYADHKPIHHYPENFGPSYHDDTLHHYGNGFSGVDYGFYGRTLNHSLLTNVVDQYNRRYNQNPIPESPRSGKSFVFPKNRKKRNTPDKDNLERVSTQNYFFMAPSFLFIILNE